MSTQKILTRALIGSLGTVALIALWMSMPIAAHAQCGDIASSCYKCHQAFHPVWGTTNWHSEYGHRYTCWNCHGGNNRAQDKEQAHIGLVVNPLEDAYTGCYPCHPNDYRQRAEQLAKQIGVTVSYHEPTLPPRTSPALNASQPIVWPLIPTSIATTHSTTWIQVLWLLPLVAVVLLVWAVWSRGIA